MSVKKVTSRQALPLMALSVFFVVNASSACAGPEGFFGSSQILGPTAVENIQLGDNLFPTDQKTAGGSAEQKGSVPAVNPSANPGVIKGFNPQPDPPGKPTPAVLDQKGLLPAVQKSVGDPTGIPIDQKGVNITNQQLGGAEAGGTQGAPIFMNTGGEAGGTQGTPIFMNTGGQIGAKGGSQGTPIFMNQGPQGSDVSVPIYMNVAGQNGGNSGAPIFMNQGVPGGGGTNSAPIFMNQGVQGAMSNISPMTTAGAPIFMNQGLGGAAGNGAAPIFMNNGPNLNNGGNVSVPIFMNVGNAEPGRTATPVQTPGGAITPKLNTPVFLLGK